MTGRPSHYNYTSHTVAVSLAILAWVGAMSTGERSASVDYKIRTPQTGLTGVCSGTINLDAATNRRQFVAGVPL